MGPLALTLSSLHSILVDETVGQYRDWSVCFSPDGKLLATAASDGVVRVSSRIFMLAVAIAVIIFEVNAQHSATFGALDLGYCQEANPQQIPGSQWGGQLACFLVRWEICCLWVSRLYDEDLGYDGWVVEDPWKPR